MKRIVVTGGAGFIGSHVAEALLRRGDQLTIIDSLHDFYSPDLKRQNLEELRASGDFEFHRVDIRDKDGLRQVLSYARPDQIIHLAARAGVRPSLDDPGAYVDVNIRGTVNLLELSRDFEVQAFVFGSSSSVYGATARTPFSEDQVELRPISPYAATKLSGEMLCFTFAHLYKLPVVCLRFFTVYGPRQRPDLAIHKFTALIEAGRPLPIFGAGTTGRDYTHVDDIVAGVLAACEFAPAQPNGQTPFDVFNLGNSHPVKLSELVKLLEQATGKKVLCRPEPMQAGDVPITWADISKAERVLGYHPSTTLQDGLPKFIAWYRTRQETLRR
jgi:UDP-glucuronate 4-epimerase